MTARTGAYMGAAQAEHLAGEIKRLHDEVAHWQAAHKDADDSLANALASHLICALETASIMYQTRRVEGRKQ